MLFGLSVQEITILVSLLGGVVLLIGGLILLFKERHIVDPASKDVVEIEVPWLGKFKMNFPAAIAILAGGLLVGYPLWRGYDSPPKLPVSGKVQIGQGKTISGILVGVLPSSHTTLTQADGHYFLNIPKGEKGMTYQAVVYLPNNNPPLFHVDVVKFNADGQGSFDYTLSGSGKK